MLATADPHTTEPEAVEAWRAQTMVTAGYPEHLALTLAADHDVDLHIACDLLARGCPLTTAWRILT